MRWPVRWYRYLSLIILSKWFVSELSAKTTNQYGWHFFTALPALEAHLAISRVFALIARFFLFFKFQLFRFGNLKRSKLCWRGRGYDDKKRRQEMIDIDTATKNGNTAKNENEANIRALIGTMSSWKKRNMEKTRPDTRPIKIRWRVGRASYAVGQGQYETGRGLKRDWAGILMPRSNNFSRYWVCFYS